LTLAEGVADGLHEQETTVGIRQNTEVVLRADLIAAQKAQAAYLAARSAKMTATNAQTVADSNARAFISSARDGAEAALRRRLRGLIDELTQLLPADDPRWFAFGLNPPAAPDTPDAPTGLTLTAGEGGSVLVDWADAPRAARYRVFKQVVGTDADFVYALTVMDSDATLNGFPHGATVRERVTAANDGGESQPSDVGEIVVT
jgi:hypothetical protein